MLIEFDNMDYSAINKFYGGEKDTLARLFTDEYNRIMYGKLGPGASIGMHKHNNNSEIIYILHGAGKAIFDNAIEELKPGACHYCPKGHSHSILNSGMEDLVFFAVVPSQ